MRAEERGHGDPAEADPFPDLPSEFAPTKRVGEPPPAERLLAASVRFDRPVDTWLQMRWVHGVDILSVWPTGVGEASGDLGGSTQKKRRGTLARIRAEIARSRYRRRIAALSRR